MTTAVIAGDFRQYKRWCREHGVHPYGRDAFYATATSVRGRRNLSVARTGSWETRKDLAQIEADLEFIAATVDRH